MDKTKCCCTIYPESLRSNLALYIFPPFLWDSNLDGKWHLSGELKNSLACHCLVLSTLGSVLLNTGPCSYKGTWVQARAPESQPLSSVCVHIGHIKQVTVLGVSNIKRCLAYFLSFIEEPLWEVFIERWRLPGFSFNMISLRLRDRPLFFFGGGWGRGGGGWKILKQIVWRGWNTEIICMEIKKCLQQDG